MAYTKEVPTMLWLGRKHRIRVLSEVFDSLRPTSQKFTTIVEDGVSMLSAYKYVCTHDVSNTKEYIVHLLAISKRKLWAVILYKDV